jgi:hypothetical protein
MKHLEIIVIMNWINYLVNCPICVSCVFPCILHYFALVCISMYFALVCISMYFHVLYMYYICISLHFWSFSIFSIFSIFCKNDHFNSTTMYVWCGCMYDVHDMIWYGGTEFLYYGLSPVSVFEHYLHSLNTTHTLFEHYTHTL